MDEDKYKLTHKILTYKYNKDFYKCLTVKLYEKSTKLKNIQKTKIKHTKIDITFDLKYKNLH